MGGTALKIYWGNAASVTIPEGVTSIGMIAFDFHHGLTNVSIPSSVTSIEASTFWRCSNLTSIIVDTQNPAYSSVEGILFNKDITVLIKYPASRQEKNYTYNIPVGVISIGECAFLGCDNLTRITIPEGVTAIGKYSFCSCRILTKITIPESVTSIEDGAFSGCRALANIIIPSNVASIGAKAFYDCPNLETVTLSRNTEIEHTALDGFSGKLIYRD